MGKANKELRNGKGNLYRKKELDEEIHKARRREGTKRETCKAWKRNCVQKIRMR